MGFLSLFSQKFWLGSIQDCEGVSMAGTRPSQIWILYMGSMIEPHHAPDLLQLDVRSGRYKRWMENTQWCKRLRIIKYDYPVFIVLYTVYDILQTVLNKSRISELRHINVWEEAPREWLDSSSLRVLGACCLSHIHSYYSLRFLLNVFLEVFHSISRPLFFSG
jgi:hypothetical protein